jgi:hypothetical protein
MFMETVRDEARKASDQTTGDGARHLQPGKIGQKHETTRALLNPAIIIERTPESNSARK